ncbi:MAG TPA: hypothetical protein VG097_12650 [Gemmata sp.]|jgi:hypothetical protein|nr:hypothetical protein [Gemmata sp.]
MKRTAATLALLAGLGGGCASTDSAAKKDPVGGFGTVTRGQQVPGVVGPNGEPIMAARGASPGGVTQAGGITDPGKVQQVALFTPYGSTSSGDCSTCAHVPGTAIAPLGNGEFMSRFYAYANGNLSGPPGSGNGPPQGFNHGIIPVPGQGPPGAVAAVGALPISGGGGGMKVANGRTSIKFTGPAGMKITWQLPNGGFNDEASGLTAPKEYNFLQGQTYRLRLTQVLPNFPGKSFYPTLEVASGNPKSITFLAHSSVPLRFENDDFEQAKSGNLVVKVIYLPDRENQDFASVVGAEEVVSTRLEPGADPVAEAQRKGTILAIVRLGNIDLENRASPAMTSPPQSMMPPRSAPIMLPGPTQTTPVAPPKPITPSLPSVPMGKPAASGSGSSGSSSTTSIPVPVPPSTLPVPPAAPGTNGGSGLPSILPPIAPNGPDGGSSLPTTLPPIK